MLKEVVGDYASKILIKNWLVWILGRGNVSENAISGVLDASDLVKKNGGTQKVIGRCHFGHFLVFFCLSGAKNMFGRDTLNIFAVYYLV